MNIDPKLQQGAVDDPLSDKPDPLSPGRTDLNPSDKARVDELPDNDGDTPSGLDDEATQQKKMPDIDPDNAELDDQPNPR